MDLTCPKCQGAMRAYERNGITIDQCAECRGVFLDRGELDRLIDAEAAFSAAASAPAAPSPPRQAAPVYGTPPVPAAPRDQQYPPDRYQEQRYDPRYDQRHDVRHDQRYDQRYDHDSDRTPYPRGYPKKRKRSFLEDLFD